MIYLAAGLLVLFVLAAAGRKARQRQMVESLRRNFVLRARPALEIYLAPLAPAVSDEQLGRAFDWIYREHLRRLRARDFADLLRKGQTTEAQSISFDICLDAGKRLCAAYPAQIGNDPEGAAFSIQAALSDALQQAGPDMYAELMPNG